MGRRAILLLVAIVIAALGATLVFLYVRGVEAKADEAHEVVQVLGATDIINAGDTADEAISSGKLALIEVPRENVVEGALDSTASLDGMVALTTVYPGEQIIPQKFGAPGTQQTITIPKGMLAVSVQLTDPARVAGYVVPGSKVAIFLSGEGTGELATGFTRTLFSDVEVIGVGSTTMIPATTTDASGAQATEQIPRTILTLALTQDQAERVIFATKNGELAFGLMTDESTVRPSDGVTFGNLFAGER